MLSSLPTVAGRRLVAPQQVALQPAAQQAVAQQPVALQAVAPQAAALQAEAHNSMVGESSAPWMVADRC